MINGTLRPWGKPQWLLGMPTLKKESWFLIGSMSTQDRCLSILKHKDKSYDIAYAAFLEIVDVDSEFAQLSRDRRDINRHSWEQLVGPIQHELITLEIFSPILKIKKLIQKWLHSGIANNIILDVSTLPERFLFPMVRWLLESPVVKNLVITYMLPERYTHEDLAYNAREASHLPTFVDESQFTKSAVKNVIVGVGFLPFSLPEWLKKTYSNSRVKVSLIFPFPSSPANVRKGWEFVRRVEPNVLLADDRQICRVAAHDISGCYDRINLITANGLSPTVFAPFGPKAHSVAMCLHAINTNSEAYFTHPSFYHPEYSMGIRMDGALPAGYAYAIRLSGVNLY